MDNNCFDKHCPWLDSIRWARVSQAITLPYLQTVEFVYIWGSIPTLVEGLLESLLLFGNTKRKLSEFLAASFSQLLVSCIALLFSIR